MALDIQKQVSDLQHKIQAMAITSKDTPFKAEKGRLGKEVPIKLPNSTRGTTQKGSTELSQREGFFCYRCGENGPIARRCTAIEDSRKVISKQSGSLKKYRYHVSASGRAESTDRHCRTKTSTVSTPRIPSLPEGLVGNPSLSQVIIKGWGCTAVMDSGSTVTIIFDQWYQKYLNHVPLHPIASLAIWGLGDSSYHYKDYVAVRVEFLEDGVCRQAKPILALLCPDTPVPNQVPVIVPLWT